MHFHYPTIDSTNTQASRLLTAGVAAPFTVTADTQTAGRGQRGSTWQSPPGNFYGTFVFPYPVTAMQAAVALAKVIGEDAQIKWPNDILVDNQKVAGILIEQQANGVCLVGIGINQRIAPRNMGYPATALGCDISTGKLYQQLHDVSNWPIGQIHHAYQQQLSWQGKVVSLQQAHQKIIGELQGIQYDGAIIIQQQQHATSYYTGQLRLA